ncbi:hypothetical protein A1O3_00090 [Capronia epimyces CBS 606.96]|uniref:Uncharacterized protein n=1 Tax=Capronia epimyces CBS 606.96 TaxID=1182542 RepID=W9YF83_9EURO|nr:uncharacterized protein A1O3_00090 [Capronia epimyces CBS 606.96]EXJ91542.1 hypothetical protein A1O3_00090 [Capronia epimyces CBS 606.96]
MDEKVSQQGNAIDGKSGPKSQVHQHLPTTTHSVAEQRATLTTSDMDEQVSQQSNAIDGKPGPKPQVNVATIQTITPPLFDHNLGPDQVEFERATPPAVQQADTEPVVQIRPPPSPAPTSSPVLSSSTEAQASSRTPSPLPSSSGSDADVLEARAAGEFFIPTSADVLEARDAGEFFIPTSADVVEARDAGESSIPAPADIGTVGPASIPPPNPPIPISKLVLSDCIPISWRDIETLWKVLSERDVSAETVFPDGELLVLPKSRFWDEDYRVVRPANFMRRLKHLLGYHIPGATPEYGFETVDTFQCNSRGPWYIVRQMAIYGLLENFPSGTLDVVYAIREICFNGQPHDLEQPGLLPDPQQDGKPTRRGKKSRAQPQQQNDKPAPSSKNSKAQPPQTSPKTKPAENSNRPTTRQTAKSSLKLTEPVQPQVIEPAHAQEAQRVQVQDAKPIVAPTKKATATPPARSQKRKQEDEDFVKPAPKKARNSRQAYDETSKKASPSEIFARRVKSALNARSLEKNNYAVFGDAILPDNQSSLDLATPVLKHAVQVANQLEDLGDAIGLNPREVAVCKELAITCDTYRCQKARFFLGLEIFVEYNHQALKDGSSDFKIWNVGKSQCQLFNNIDVNKSSDLYQAFESWGWVEPMGKKDPSTKNWTISTNYLGRFPESHRRRLMEEVAKWEAENVPNAGKCYAKV